MDYTKLLNKFINIYNIQHNVKNSFFDGINDSEITSTNPQHEMLYEYLERHKELEKENETHKERIISLTKEIETSRIQFNLQMNYFIKTYPPQHLIK